jgi:type II secretory pathway component PulF
VGNFYWEGTDKQGSLHEGALESHSREAAKEHLLQEGYYRVRFWKIQQSYLHSSLNNTEITEFLLQLHRLLKSGVELDDALGFAIQEQKNNVLSFLLCRIRQDLRDGLSMSSALRHYQAFPQIVAKMIEVAESTGRLTEVLGMLLEFYQFQQKMILEQKRLLNYPLVVFSIFIVLSLGAVIFMVPMFKRMYAGLGEDLFWLTRALVKLSDSLRFNPEAWILGTLFSGAIIVFVYRLFGWYWLLNLIPGGKRLQQSVQMLFYSRSMEIMLLTGVHLQEALALAEEMFPKLLRKRIAPVREAVDSGKSLCDAYAMVPVFSPMFVKMVALGESSGHLPSSFARIGSHNQEALKKIMAWASTLIEPLLMILIALGVLGFLLSMYLPLFRMAERF